MTDLSAPRITDRTPGPADEPLAVRDPSRRRVLVAGGVIAAAGAVTAACGSSGATEGAADSAPVPRPTDSAAGSAASAGTTIPTADIPVGGGRILADQQVVITQPTAGSFMAFTAVCTHRGCVVASVADGTIACPCHGSKFSITDGSVTGGPAPAPLAPVPITVAGSTITLT